MSRSLLRVPTLVAVLLSLSACGIAFLDEVPPENPGFSGPWAHELQKAYEESSSDVFRKIVADGKITEAEYSEAHQHSIQCMADGGFPGVTHHPEEGVTQMPEIPIEKEALARELMTDCDEKFGIVDIDIWYNNLHLNPDNLNWDEGELQCLIKHKYLPLGSTVADLKAWYETEHEKHVRDAQVRVCGFDPFNKLQIDVAEMQRRQDKELENGGM